MANDLVAQGTSATNPAEWLEWVGQLTTCARRARQSSWWALTTAGAMVLASAPLYLPVGHPDRPGQVNTNLHPSSLLLSGSPTAHPWGAALFWLVAVPVWYLACVLRYQRSAALSGYRTSPWLWGTAGLAAFGLLAASAPTATGLDLAPGLVPWVVGNDILGRGMAPLFVLLVPLGALAWAERSRPLALAWPVLAGAVTFCDLYNVSNTLARVGPAVGRAANVALVGLVFLAGGLGTRSFQRPPRSRAVVMA